MLDAKEDDRLIPIIVHSEREGPERMNVPITRDYIKANAGKDGVEVYNAWVSPNSSVSWYCLRVFPKAASKFYAKLSRRPWKVRNFWPKQGRGS